MRQVGMVDAAFTTDMPSRSYMHLTRRRDVWDRGFVGIRMWNPEFHRKAVCHVTKGHWQGAVQADKEGGRPILESFSTLARGPSGLGSSDETYCRHLFVEKW